MERKVNTGHSFVCCDKSRLWRDNFCTKFPSAHGLGESWKFMTLLFYECFAAGAHHSHFTEQN